MDQYPSAVRRSNNKNKIDEMTLDTILKVYHNNMKRYHSIKDPSIKYTLLMDKLCLTIDILMASLSLNIDDNQIDPLYKAKIEDMCGNFQEEIAKLMDWIQSPIYSPDHPHGRKLMESSQESFEKNL